MDSFDIYNYLDGKISEKKKAQINEDLYMRKYTVQLMNDLICMLEYENVPDGLDPNFLELFKLVNGHCIVAKDGENYVALQGSFSGSPNYYGYGEKYVGVSLGGQFHYDGTYNTESAVLFKNNGLMSPDILNVLEYADLFTQVKISKRLNVIYSRYLPIFGVSDTKTKKALEDAVKQLSTGVPQITLLTNLEQIIEGAPSFERLDISDVKNTAMLQYIDKFEDDLLRGFYSYYGHAMNGTTKLAQQSVAEVTNNDSVSAIYPLNRLKAAKESCDLMNKIFGTNMSVHFSEAWEVRHNDLTADIEEGKESEEDDTENMDSGPDENVQ